MALIHNSTKVNFIRTFIAYLVKIKTDLSRFVNYISAFLLLSLAFITVVCIKRYLQIIF